MYSKDYQAFLRWYYLRDTLYEWSFFVLVAVLFTEKSIFGNSVAFGCGLLIICSISDKMILGNRSLQDRDLLVLIPASVLIATIYYLNEKSKNERVI